MPLRFCLLASLALALPAQAVAQSAPPPCLTRAEAQSVVTFALPTAVVAVDEMCRKVLPPETGFAATAEALHKQYQPAADAAWPATRTALTRLLGHGEDPAKGVLSAFLASDDPTPLRTFVTALVADKPMKPKTCAAIGRILPLIQPMPAQNMAGLFEFAIEAMMDDKKDGKKPAPFTICPAPAAGQ